MSVFITTREALDKFGISRQNLRTLIKCEEVRVKKQGKGKTDLVHFEDLQTFVNNAEDPQSDISTLKLKKLAIDIKVKEVDIRIKELNEKKKINKIHLDVKEELIATVKIIFSGLSDLPREMNLSKDQKILFRDFLKTAAKRIKEASEL